VSRESVLEGARKLAALRRLDLVDASSVVTWATEQLVAEEPLDSLVELASEPVSANSRTVDALLEKVLRALGDRPMADERAGWLIARLLAERIVGGSIEPAIGARKIWSDVARRVPSLEPELRVFIGLASEWEDSVDHRDEYEEDIVAAATQLLAKTDQDL
jgi:hypothetical protein